MVWDVEDSVLADDEASVLEMYFTNTTNRLLDRVLSQRTEKLPSGYVVSDDDAGVC
jgi:hypothetical protein